MFRSVIFSALIFLLLSCSKDEISAGMATFSRKTVDNFNTHAVTLKNITLSEIPTLLWTHELRGFAHFSCPVIVNNHIYAPAGLGDGLFKINLQNGTTVYSIPDFEINKEQLVYENGMLFFSTDETLVAYDTNSESVKWNVNIQHDLYSMPLVTKELIIIGDILRGVYGFNKSDGKLRWVLEDVPIDIRGGIAGDESTIKFGGLDGHIYCLETNTGKVKWIYETCEDVSCPKVSCPTISDGIVYAGDYKGSIFAVDENTGNEIWKKQYDPAIDWQNIAVNDKYMIITGRSPSTVLKANFIICLDKKTGNQIWAFKKNAAFDREDISDPYIINNDYVLFATDDGISLMDINNQNTLWTISPKKGEFNNNDTSIFGYAIADDKLVYIGRDGKLFCYKFN